MPLTLARLDGSDDAAPQVFGDERERIVIGRDASVCDVVLPPELTIVGRQHVALVRKLSGDYAVDLFGEHYLEIDGEPAEPGAALPSGSTLTLGRRHGPRFSVTIDGYGPDLMAATLPQDRALSARRLSQRARRLGWAGAAVAILAAGAAGYATLVATAGQVDREAVAAQVASLRQAQHYLAAQQIPLGERERLARSVFAVMRRDAAGNEDLIGTAWAFRTDLLATNAHVALEIDKLQPGETMVVRAPGSTGAGTRVVGIKVHPSYAAIAHFVDEDPLFAANYGGPQKVANVDGYDVAVLKVADPVPDDMILTIADPDRVENLKPGEAIAYAGYPYENVAGSSVLPRAPTPQLHTGAITALTDFFYLPAPPAERRLVQHDLPLTGGASGSPVIDAQGHVVAMINAMNAVAVDGRRVPSAVLNNYAQRIDTLLDLLDGKAEGRLGADESYWRQQTAAFTRRTDMIASEALYRERPQDGFKPVLAHEVVLQFGAHDHLRFKGDDGKPAEMRVKTLDVPTTAGSRLTIVGCGRSEGTVVWLALMAKGRVEKEDDSGIDSCAAVSIEKNAEANRTVTLGTDDIDTAVTLRIYGWQRSGS